MKKRLWIILAAVALVLVLFVPIPGGGINDGGTREYTALTYKVVVWNRLTGINQVYQKTCVYWFPDNFKSIDALWEQEYTEQVQQKESFLATVLEVYESSVLVAPLDGEPVGQSSDRICFNTAHLSKLDVQAGSAVRVFYDGVVMESYPAQIRAEKWEAVNDLRQKPYTAPWLDRETAQQGDYYAYEHVIINQIYSDCFFASSAIPMPGQIKLNGVLGKEWCVGDQVRITYQNAWYDSKNYRTEADLLSVSVSDWVSEPGVAYKPVIYLYPEAEIDVSVNLELNGKLTCTYPAYGSGWQVTAAPDGTLMDEKGQTYNYLYWEGITDAQWDMRKGFCIKGEDTAAFLEEALEKLGLTRREANEFIVYWLPLMEENSYNIIAFQTDRYTDAAKLNVDPAPDTVIRVFMTWQASETPVDIPDQELAAPEREGFTVIEWGGTQIS